MEYDKEIKVRNHNNKIKIILNDKYLILKYLFSEKKIIRRNIRSALISGNSFLILTYENDIIEYPIPMDSNTFKEGLKLVINKINQENIIFRINNYYEFYTPISLLLCQSYTFIFKDKVSIMSVIIFIFSLAIPFFIIKFFSKPPVFYDIDKKEILKLNRKKQVHERFKISDVTLIKQNSKETIYSIKSTSSYFKLENSYKKITYPIKYVNEISNLNNNLNTPNYN